MLYLRCLVVFYSVGYNKLVFQTWCSFHEENQYSPLKARFFSPIRIDQYRPTVLRCNDGCSGFFFICFVMVCLVFRAPHVAMVEAQDEAGIFLHHEGDLLFPTSMDSK